MTRVTLERRKTSAGNKYYYLVCSRQTASGRKRKVIATGTTHKAVAVKHQRDLELRIAEGFDPWRPRPDAVTLSDAREEFIRDCTSRGLRKATVDTYSGVLGQFAEHVGPDTYLSDLDTETVRAFCVQSHLAPSSRHHRFRHVRSFLNWAKQAGYLDESPADGANLPRPKKQTPDFISPNDFERILTALDYQLEKPGRYATHERTAFWLKPMVQTAYYLGLRRGEVIRLRWRDVNLENGTLTVRESKGGDRHLPMHSELVDVLRLWYQVTGPDGPVFVTSNGTSPNPDFIGRAFRRVCKVAGISTGGVV